MSIMKTKGIELRIEHGRDAGVEDVGQKQNLAPTQVEEPLVFLNHEGLPFGECVIYQ